MQLQPPPMKETKKEEEGKKLKHKDRQNANDSSKTQLNGKQRNRWKQNKIKLKKKK